MNRSFFSSLTAGAVLRRGVLLAVPAWFFLAAAPGQAAAKGEWVSQGRGAVWKPAAETSAAASGSKSQRVSKSKSKGKSKTGSRKKPGRSSGSQTSPASLQGTGSGPNSGAAGAVVLLPGGSGGNTFTGGGTDVTTGAGLGNGSLTLGGGVGAAVGGGLQSGGTDLTILGQTNITVVATVISNSHLTSSGANSIPLLNTGTNNAAGTFLVDTLDGSGVGLSKVGSGTMVLSAANTYTGITRIYSGTLTATHPAGLGSASGGTIITGNRENSSGFTTTLNFNITTASTPAAPNVVAEPITLNANLSNDGRTSVVNAAESLRLNGGIVMEGDGIHQISAMQAAGDNLQINGGISGTGTGVVFLRGLGEMQVNSVINIPNGYLSKTDGGTLILNATGHNYREANFVAGTVRTDVVNALDTGALVRLGQNGVANTLDLNGNNQMVGGISTNPGVGDNFARTITSVTAATLDINNTAADYVFSGTISGAITLQKSGSGTQVLTGTNFYTGATNVSGGTLVINGNHSTATGAVTIHTGATLGGTGSISGLVTNSGVLAPGTSDFSPGTLTISGGVILQESSALSFDLLGTDHMVGGGVNDLFTGITHLTLNGALNVNDLAAGSFLSADLGDSWRLLNYFGTLTDRGLSLGTLPALPAGLSFAVNTAVPGQVNLVVVPEPGVAGILALSGGVLAGCRRRRTEQRVG